MREDVRENRKESGRYGTPRLRAQGSRDASAIRRWANALNTLAGAALCGLEACARGIRVTHDHYRYGRILHEGEGAGDKGEMGTVVAYGRCGMCWIIGCFCARDRWCRDGKARAGSGRIRARWRIRVYEDVRSCASMCGGCL